MESLNQWGPKWGDVKQSQIGQCSKLHSKPWEDEGRKDSGEEGVTGTKPASSHLGRPPLMRGLLGPKGLGMLAHPLLLGLHSRIVPGAGQGGSQSPPVGPSPDSPHIPGLPLCVEGATGVQQQEELPLGLGAVPREEIVLQGHWASDGADHIDLATLQPPEQGVGGMTEYQGWELGKEPTCPPSSPPWPRPGFLGARLEGCPCHPVSQHAK